MRRLPCLYSNDLLPLKGLAYDISNHKKFILNHILTRKYQNNLKHLEKHIHGLKQPKNWPKNPQSTQNQNYFLTQIYYLR
jgi:hypothetical protein